MPPPIDQPGSNQRSDDEDPIFSLNILVAEDNKTNQLVLKTMLKKTDARLTIAQNGREAVDAYPDLKPDLILMDMSMPEMDGLKATQTIRLLEETMGWSRTPIIALTANAMKGDRERCIKAGMNDNLSKPIRKDKLLRTLQTWSSANTPSQTKVKFTSTRLSASG